MEFVNNALAALTPADKQFHDQFVIVQVGNTEEQLTKIGQLRQQLEDILENENDNLLRRFLVARAWVVSDAEEMFRGERKWRTESFPKTIRSESMYRFLYFKTTEVHPEIRDRYNRPLVIMTGVRYNPNLNLKDNEQMGDYFIWQMELLRRLVVPPHPQFVLILDLQGWGIRSFDYGMAQTLAGIAKPYYPDYMGATFIINYPFVMWGVWKLANLLLEQRTKDKIQFLGKNDYVKLFPLMFGKENIYERFGGSKKEPKPAGDEWDKESLKEWASVKALSLPEQENVFAEKLHNYFEQNVEEKNAWEPLMNTANMDAMLPQQLN